MRMTTAKAIADQLRKVIALLDKNPDLALTSPILSFHTYTRKDFLATVMAVPKPFDKERTNYGDFQIRHDHADLLVYSSAPQSATCTLIVPAVEAVYDCLPLLSEEDHDGL